MASATQEVALQGVAAASILPAELCSTLLSSGFWPQLGYLEPSHLSPSRELKAHSSCPAYPPTGQGQASPPWVTTDTETHSLPG